MIKAFVILRKKPGMSAEAFHEYWKNDHAKLVAKLPGLVKYVQHHVVSFPRPGYEQTDEAIDGVVETIWESQEAAYAAAQSPEMAAVMQDEVTFLGTSNHFVHTTVVTESVEVI